MARIKNLEKYPKDPLLTGDDYVIGTDIDDNQKTKNFSLDAIANYVNNYIDNGGGTPIIQNNKIVEIDLTSKFEDDNIWQKVNQLDSFKVREDELFVFKNYYVVNNTQVLSYWLLKSGSKFYGKGELSTDQNDFLLLRLDNLVIKTSDLINDGEDGNNPFISEDTIAQLNSYDSISDAVNILGLGKLFTYTEQNLDGIPSPNNSIIGITK